MKQILISILAFAACALFSYGMFKAWYLTMKNKAKEMPAALIPITDNFSNVLAVNLGVILGIQVFSKQNLEQIFANYTIVTISALAAIYYFIILFLTLIIWLIKGFKTEPEIVVSLIPDLSKKLIALMTGALIIVLTTI